MDCFCKIVYKHQTSRYLQTSYKHADIPQQVPWGQIQASLVTKSRTIYMMLAHCHQMCARMSEIHRNPLGFGHFKNLF